VLTPLPIKIKLVLNQAFVIPQAEIPLAWIMNFRLSRPSWSYGSWIYNYICNQCLSLLKLWVRIPSIVRLWVTCGNSVPFSL